MLNIVLDEVIRINNMPKHVWTPSYLHESYASAQRRVSWDTLHSGLWVCNRLSESFVSLWRILLTWDTVSFIQIWLKLTPYYFHISPWKIMVWPFWRLRNVSRFEQTGFHYCLSKFHQEILITLRKKSAGFFLHADVFLGRKYNNFDCK